MGGNSMPDMFFVDSSNVESIGYDPEAQELHVTFLGSPGGTYVYLDVPDIVWEDLQVAASKGSFLNREVKPRFAFDKR